MFAIRNLYTTAVKCICGIFSVIARHNTLSRSCDLIDHQVEGVQHFDVERLEYE